MTHGVTPRHTPLCTRPKALRVENIMSRRENLLLEFLVHWIIPVHEITGQSHFIYVALFNINSCHWKFTVVKKLNWLPLKQTYATWQNIHELSQQTQFHCTWANQHVILKHGWHIKKKKDAPKCFLKKKKRGHSRWLCFNTVKLQRTD